MSLQSRTPVLVTGGAGFIGSHVCVELINSGYLPVVVDNLCNSKPKALQRVAEIAGLEPVLHVADINDKDEMRKIFQRYSFAAVMHFAGLKAVGESSHIPLTYYRNNVAGTLSLVEVMEEFQVFNLRSEEHTSELQSRPHLVCRLLLEKKKSKRVVVLNINRSD